MTDFIHVYEDAASPELCAELCACFDASPRAAPGETGFGVEPEKKDSLDITITRHAEWRSLSMALIDALWPRLQDYMSAYPDLLTGAVSATAPHPQTSAMVGLTPENFAEFGLPHLDDLIGREYRCGEINVQKYLAGRGGYHHWHSETYPQGPDCEALHRVLLFQFYLNDVVEGGGTEFLHQRRTVTPKAGRLVIAPAGFTHTHKGHVPISGDKYIATSWILFQRAETMFASIP